MSATGQLAESQLCRQRLDDLLARTLPRMEAAHKAQAARAESEAQRLRILVGELERQLAEVAGKMQEGMRY